MLLAPSFSPKVQTVLDCLFNTVGALAGKTCPSTSRSFSYSVVLAMPEEAWEATLASQAAGAPQDTLPAQSRGTAHSMLLGLSPRLRWTWADMRACRRSLSSVPAASCCVLGSCGMQCLTIAGMAGNGAGARAAPHCAGAQTPTALHWPLSHCELTTTDTSGNHMGQVVAEPFWSRTSFYTFNLAALAVNKHRSQSAGYITELKTYKNCGLDHLNRLWFL